MSPVSNIIGVSKEFYELNFSLKLELSQSQVQIIKASLGYNLMYF